MTALPPIPAHLPEWQAGHLAWLASRGKPTRYAVPEGVEPCRANLREADLCGANLREANLIGANRTNAIGIPKEHRLSWVRCDGGAE
jgi:hypothetical protein